MSRDLLVEFWDPRHILGTVEARNFTSRTSTTKTCKSDRITCL